MAANRILGWRAAASMTTALVLDAVEQAIWVRARDGIADLTGLVHHTDSETVPAGVPRVLTRTVMDPTGCWCLGAPRGS